MAFLFKFNEDPGNIWADRFTRELPSIPFKVWPHEGDPADIRFLLLYEPAENIRQFKNLEILFTMSAGAEQALGMDLPQHVKLVRMIEPGLTAGMVEYVVGSVLMLHREMPKYLERQMERVWQPDPVRTAGTRRVGIMGAGVLGLACLNALKPFGFPLSIWSRTHKEIDGVACHAGEDELDVFLAATDILICLLPLTPATKDILNARTLGLLPQGASLINVGRGGHVVEADLLASLDSGQLSQAILDVTRAEPLPGESPLWVHKKIWITPHIASDTQAVTGVEAVLQNLKRHLSGQTLLGEVDRLAGY